MTPGPPEGANDSDAASVISGTQLRDVLHGTPGDDSLFGKGGPDALFGAGGDDYVDGEYGNDELHGGPGNDTMAGRAGDDRLFGDAGADHITGDRGFDHIAGGLNGNDEIFGSTSTSTPPSADAARATTASTSSRGDIDSCGRAGQHHAPSPPRRTRAGHGVVRRFRVGHGLARATCREGRPSGDSCEDVRRADVSTPSAGGDRAGRCRTRRVANMRAEDGRARPSRRPTRLPTSPQSSSASPPSGRSLDRPVDRVSFGRPLLDPAPGTRLSCIRAEDEEGERSGAGPV